MVRKDIAEELLGAGGNNTAGIKHCGKILTL